MHDKLRLRKRFSKKDTENLSVRLNILKPKIFSKTTNQKFIGCVNWAILDFLFERVSKNPDN